MNNFQINTWLKDLNHSDNLIRQNAILKLSSLDDVRFFKIMSGYFSDGHPNVRETLYQVFVQQKNRRLAEIVADALYMPQISAKSLALRILKEYNDEAILPLRRISRNKNSAIRKIVADLLGDIDSPQAGKLLVEMLGSSNNEVLFAIIRGLGKQNTIESVPRLQELFETNENLRPVILNSMAKIFLNWEKRLLCAVPPEKKSKQIPGILNAVQENGNSAALNQLLVWLNEEKDQLADEIILAIVSILEKNDNCILPKETLSDLNRVFENQNSNIQVFAISKCWSHIPSTDAFRKLSQLYFSQTEDRLVEQQVLQWIAKFPAIFFLWKREANQENYISLLDLLYENRIHLFDSVLWVAYLQSNNNSEKMKLMRLAALTGLPETKDELLRKLDNAGSNQLVYLDCLKNYSADEQVLNIFLEQFEMAEQWSDVFNFLKLELVEKSEFVINYLFQNADTLPFDSMKRYLDLVLSMPIDHKIHFFAYWFTKSARSRVQVLLNTSKTNQNADNIILVAWALRKNIEIAEHYLSLLNVDTEKMTTSMELRTFVENISEIERNDTLSLVEKFFPGILSSNATMPIIPGLTPADRTNEIVLHN